MVSILAEIKLFPSKGAINMNGGCVEILVTVSKLLSFENNGKRQWLIHPMCNNSELREALDYVVIKYVWSWEWFHVLAILCVIFYLIRDLRNFCFVKSWASGRLDGRFMKPD